MVPNGSKNAVTVPDAFHPLSVIQSKNLQIKPESEGASCWYNPAQVFKRKKKEPDCLILAEWWLKYLGKHLHACSCNFKLIKYWNWIQL